ncbi:hypothetical protein CDO73_26230 [Saccharibacillus sp. O23]|uniref:hypothetical protein n=1 Tax=Saccharibacillus sp. O23 TaxID=2009338 RepID=UPI000B4E42C1|nr:hypothetical protein [Saccharibacillus sp. O23]OWR25678.1 hypothetical protein CDO73_26230 [Saccharibacillus sp. O23]
MKPTMKIYKITVSAGASIHDEGVHHGLEPWGHDTPVMKGWDDEGTLYYVPEGYEVARTTEGRLGLFDAAGQSVDIYTNSENKPYILTDHEILIIQTA